METVSDSERSAPPRCKTLGSGMLSQDNKVQWMETTKESDVLFLWKMKAHHDTLNLLDDDERCASLAMTAESDEGSDSSDIQSDPTTTTTEACSCPFLEEVPMSEPDIYGQRHPIESAELIQCKLQEFDLAVAAIPPKSRQTIDIAEKQCPQLLTNQFKLLFLRCDCYNTAAAAKRYAKYWDRRLEVFGEKLAFQPITIENLPPEDLVPLGIGALQIINRTKTGECDDERDMIFFQSGKLEPTKYSRESALRAFWYFFHALLEDEQVQQRGLVLLCYSQDFSSRNRDPAFTRMCIASLQGCLPIRLSAFHGCHSPPFYRFVTAMLMMFLGERLRKRVLNHGNASEKVLNALVNKYHIPADCIPTQCGGTLEMDAHEWIQSRKSEAL